jgi:hypothetical protein
MNMAAVIVLHCGCGRSYTAESWKQLRLLGRHLWQFDDEYPDELLETRQCPCGSSHSIDLHEHPDAADTRGMHSPEEERRDG